MEAQDKPNCYECIHRRNVPGDCHSSCAHPEVSGSDPLSMFLGMPASSNKLNVKGNPHGVNNGWFAWPWNFDPVWLDSCDGFEKSLDK